MADAAGNAVIAPPDDLPDDEHDAWTRFVILGAGEQFKLPDAEKNSRLSAAQRGTARRNRRRDNRDLLARLEAAAQPIPALPAEQQPCPAIQAIAGPSNPAIDYEVLERGVQLRRVEPGDDIHFPFHGDTVFFECSPMHRAWVHTLCAPWGRFTVGAASNTWMSPNHGYVPVMFDVAITRMSLGETVSLRAPAGAPFIFVGHLLPEHVRPAGWLGVAAGPEGFNEWYKKIMAITSTESDGLTVSLTLKKIERAHCPRSDVYPFPAPSNDAFAYDSLVNDGSERYLQFERLLRERTQRLFLALPADLRAISEETGEVSLILDAFAFVTQPRFAEVRRRDLYLLFAGLETKSERDAFADFWLRQGNTAEFWLTSDVIHGDDLPIFYKAIQIFPPHPEAPLCHPIAHDMELLFNVTELGWIYGERKTRPMTSYGVQRRSRFGPRIECDMVRTLRRRIRERQFARLASGDVEGLVGVTPEVMEHARARRLRHRASQRRRGGGGGADEPHDEPEDEDDDADVDADVEMHE